MPESDYQPGIDPDYEADPDHEAEDSVVALCWACMGQAPVHRKLGSQEARVSSAVMMPFRTSAMSSLCACHTPQHRKTIHDGLISRSDVQD